MSRTQAAHDSMTQSMLLTAKQLFDLCKEDKCITVDCRFVLDKPSAGFESYLKSHIPGAVYAHLNDDLSSPVTPESGRHPLPDAGRFAAFLARAGWQPGTKLVAYDDTGGAIAARLWWLMKYFGHADDAALLDGGISAWSAAGFAFERDRSIPAPKPTVSLGSCDEMVMSTSEIVESMSKAGILLVDARAAERYTGLIEPIDSVAGHITGAVNYPYVKNLTAEGAFRSLADIRKSLEDLTGNERSRHVVHMCGSGVTACLNIFASELAGIEGSKLYVGSWSEWIRDPSRPVA